MKRNKAKTNISEITQDRIKEYREKAIFKLGVTKEEYNNMFLDMGYSIEEKNINKKSKGVIKCSVFWNWFKKIFDAVCVEYVTYGNYLNKEHFINAIEIYVIEFLKKENLKEIINT